MATLTKKWDFTSDAESFTLTNCSWDSSGAILATTSGRNGKVDYIATSPTVSYASIGVPSDALAITGIVLKVTHKCTAYTGTVDYIDFSADFDGTILIPLVTYTGVTSYATETSNLLTVDKTPTDTFSVAVDGYIDLGNDKNAVGTTMIDSIELVVTYTPNSTPISISVPLATATAAGMAAPGVTVVAIIPITSPALSVTASIPVAPVIHSDQGAQVPVPAQSVSAEILSTDVIAIATIVITTPVMTVVADAHVNSAGELKPVDITTPQVNVAAKMIEPTITQIIHLASLSSSGVLSLLDEVIEGSGVSLSKDGALTVVEIIEDSSFSLSNGGVLTVVNFNEQAL